MTYKIIPIFLGLKEKSVPVVECDAMEHYYYIKYWRLLKGGVWQKVTAYTKNLVTRELVEDVEPEVLEDMRKENIKKLFEVLIKESEHYNMYSLEKPL